MALKLTVSDPLHIYFIPHLETSPTDFIKQQQHCLKQRNKQQPKALSSSNLGLPTTPNIL